MTGTDLKLSGTRQDFDTRTGEPIVLMEFTDKGAKKFQEITRDMAQRGKLLFNTVGGGQGDPSAFLQHFAIVLDREIRSWPTIDFTEYPGGITGSNGAQITGLQSIGEAKNLALVLQTGALPVEFRTLDQTAISATLGKDSLQEAKLGRDGRAFCSSRSSCSSSTASSASSPCSASASTRRSCTRRSSSSTSR